MSDQDLIDDIDEEREIAKAAACALHECFTKAKQNGPVLCVENDTVVRKIPDGETVLIKSLSGRVPGLTQRVRSLGTIKIKKQKF